MAAAGCCLSSAAAAVVEVAAFLLALNPHAVAAAVCTSLHPCLAELLCITQKALRVPILKLRELHIDLEHLFTHDLITVALQPIFGIHSASQSSAKLPQLAMHCNACIIQRWTVWQLFPTDAWLWPDMTRQCVTCPAPSSSALAPAQAPTLGYGTTSLPCSFQKHGSGSRRC